MPGFWVNDKGTLRQVADVLEWARDRERDPKMMFADGGQCVGYTELPGEVCVSTVFLGLDHNHFGGSPILFETKIFGGKMNNYQERYKTSAEAEAGHKAAVEMAKA